MTTENKETPASPDLALWMDAVLGGEQAPLSYLVVQNSSAQVTELNNLAKEIANRLLRKLYIFERGPDLAGVPPAQLAAWIYAGLCRLPLGAPLTHTLLSGLFEPMIVEWGCEPNGEEVL